MKNLKQIGVVVFLSVSMCAMSQNRIVNRMDRSVKALTQMQKMMGWEDEPKIVEQNPLTDIDGNVYQTVKVGDNIWMAENLKVNRYRNGDSIANITDSIAWSGMSTGAWCEYNNDHGNGEKFGKLYNFYAVSDKRELAPKGWHVATLTEWKTLTTVLAGIKVEVKGDIQTQILDVENKLGFAIMSGIREGKGNFGGIGLINFFWSSTQYDKDNTWTWIVGGDKLLSWISNEFKQNGCPVRCVKDAPTVEKKMVKTTNKKKK